MRYTLLIVATFILITFTNCSNVAKQTIEGWWTIDTVAYQGHNMRFCLLGNSLNFEGNRMEFPVTFNYCNEIIATNKPEGEWKLIETGNSGLDIIITSENLMFAGEHKIRFFKDEQNKLLKMEISSADLFIICRKGLYSYDDNQKSIDQLINMTH